MKNSGRNLMVTSLSPYDPPISTYAQICAKVRPRTTKNGVTLILRTDSNSTTSKTPITVVSSKQKEFNKLIQKNALIANLDDSKIFAKVPYLCVKFGGKHDGVVSKPVPPTFFELGSIFVQTFGPESLNMAPSKFCGRIRIRLRRKHP